MPELLALHGRFVELVPMEVGHVDGLLAAAASDRSTFGFTPVPWDRASMSAYVQRGRGQARRRRALPFVTYSAASGRIVGSTRFYDLSPWDWSSLPPGSESQQRFDRPDVASIGYTWLDPVAQRTPINTEAKLLMLGHAFEDWRCLAGAHQDRRPQQPVRGRPSNGWASPSTGCCGPTSPAPTGRSGTRPCTRCGRGMAGPPGPPRRPAWSR